MIDLLLQAAAAHLLHRHYIWTGFGWAPKLPYQVIVAAIQVRDYGGRRPLIPRVCLQ